MAQTHDLRFVCNVLSVFFFGTVFDN